MLTFIIGFSIAFVFYVSISPLNSISIRIPYTSYKIALYHWIYLLMFLPSFYNESMFSFGFGLGGILQSFLWYKDNFKVIKRITTSDIYHQLLNIGRDIVDDIGTSPIRAIENLEKWGVLYKHEDELKNCRDCFIKAGMNETIRVFICPNNETSYIIELVCLDRGDQEERKELHVLPDKKTVAWYYWSPSNVHIMVSIHKITNDDELLRVKQHIQVNEMLYN